MISILFKLILVGFSLTTSSGFTFSSRPTLRNRAFLSMSTTATPPSPPSPPSSPTAESFEFTSDVSRTMEIIINSLYSDRSVFLRELVSNAADACDKKRFLTVTSGQNDDSDSDSLEIKIKTDKQAKLVVIEDSGVGMSKVSQSFISFTIVLLPKLTF